DLGSGQWALPGLRGLFDDLLAHDTSFESFEVEHEFPSIGTRVMLLSARQIHRDSETARTILLAVEDITARRQAERELRASEEVRYRRLFETAMEGILLIDADSGEVTTVNPAWTSLTGRGADAVDGGKIWELQEFEDVDKVR